MKKGAAEATWQVLTPAKCRSSMTDFTQIFCVIDDFFKTFEPTYWQYLKQEKLKIRVRQATLTYQKSRRVG